ncbi:MAG: hypothetical protein IJV80_05520 [Clostridia bacterium]|nr:hypothetical protein [Clostridia bacterium]
MKKIGFILGLHGVVFTIFTLVNILIDEYVYTFLSSLIHSTFFIELFDWLIAGSLYVILYRIIFGLFEFFTIRVKKDILPIGGKWYHVHIKLNVDGSFKNVDFLRGGETNVSQELNDVTFEAVNHLITLKDDKLDVEDNPSKNTTWTSWAVDWQGKEVLTTCFKARTLSPESGVSTDRHGIHRLKIDLSKGVMNGDFADEYPSPNRGLLFFFRDEQKRNEFAENFLRNKHL